MNIPCQISVPGRDHRPALPVMAGMLLLLLLINLLLLLCGSPVMAANREIEAALRRGDHKVAITLLSKQLEHTDLQPTDRAIMLGQRGIEYAYLSEFDAAMQDYEQAIAL